MKTITGFPKSTPEMGVALALNANSSTSAVDELEQEFRDSLTEEQKVSYDIIMLHKKIEIHNLKYDD